MNEATEIINHMSEEDAKELLFFVIDKYSIIGISILGSWDKYTSEDFVKDIKGKLHEVFIIPELKRAVDSNPLNKIGLEIQAARNKNISNTIPKKRKSEI